MDTEPRDAAVPDRRDPEDEVSDRQGVALRSILESAIANWGTTARLVVLVAVCVTLLCLAIGLLQVDIVVGPVRITRHAW